jgi:pilus assembly protein Flp/PilA
MLKQALSLPLVVAFLNRTKAPKKGQSLAEYGLILALIAVVCIAGLTALGGNVNTMLNGLSSTIGGVSTAP